MEPNLEHIHNLGIDLSTNTIYIGSEGRDEEGEYGVDFEMASRFIKNLNHLSSRIPADEVIKVYMISCGGDWNYGMAMYDAIVDCPQQIEFHSMGHARSMSSIIPQSADKRIIYKHADFMIHNGSYSDAGEYTAVISAMEYGKRSCDLMLDIYANRCDGSNFCKENGLNWQGIRNFIEDKMKQKVDWWMDAYEAVYYGFMDEVR